MLKMLWFRSETKQPEVQTTTELKDFREPIWVLIEKDKGDEFVIVTRPSEDSA